MQQLPRNPAGTSHAHAAPLGIGSRRPCSAPRPCPLPPAAQVAALTNLPTIQLTLEAASVSTLVIPISLEGCRMPGDGNTNLYQRPWYTKAVRGWWRWSAHCAAGAAAARGPAGSAGGALLGGRVHSRGGCRAAPGLPLRPPLPGSAHWHEPGPSLPWPQDVERVVFEDTAAGQDPFQTLGGMFRTCSYGSSSLTRANRCGEGAVEREVVACQPVNRHSKGGSNASLPACHAVPRHAMPLPLSLACLQSGRGACAPGLQWHHSGGHSLQLALLRVRWVPLPAGALSCALMPLLNCLVLLLGLLSHLGLPLHLGLPPLPRPAALAPTLPPPCPPAGDFVGWLEAALEKLTAQGVKVDDYAYKMVVLPPGTACYWVGLGYVGCDWTFVCATW